MDIKSKVIGGVFWSSVGNFSGQGINFVVGIILARLLTPEDFGIIGIITVFTAIFKVITDTGFQNALIRKKECTNEDYSTAFYYNILVGTILYCLVYLFAPLIAKFFKIESLTFLLRFVGIIIIINSFFIIQDAILIRKIQFKTQSKVLLIVSFTAGIVGIYLAYSGWGVMSLAIHIVLKQLLYGIFIWIYIKWWPLWLWSKTSFKYLFSFGSKILLTVLIEKIYENILTFVIGKNYSSTVLGYYSRADQFNTIFTSNITNVFQKVTFPVLASLQNEEEQLKHYYRKIIITISWIIFPLVFFLAAISKPLIVNLIGIKWLEASLYLKIICMASYLIPLRMVNLNVLYVRGRSDLVLKLQIYRKLVEIPCIILGGIFLNVVYLLFLLVGLSIYSYILTTYYSGKLIDFSLKMQIISILKPLIISVGMFGIFELVNEMYASNSLQFLFIEGSCMAVLYVFFLYKFQNKLFITILNKLRGR